MDQKYTIGVLHFLISLMISSYALIFSKNSFDYVYIFYTICVIISWTLLNGECLVTYLIKINEDEKYVPGKDVLNNDDMYVCPISNENTNIIINLSMLLWWYSIRTVMIRNKYPEYIPLSIIFLWIMYKILLHTYENHHENGHFHFYQRVICAFLILLLGITIYHTKIKILENWIT